jgi:hypothetical protein
MPEQPPTPSTLRSVDLLICEKILREDNGTVSAFRIIDLFNLAGVPEPMPLVPIPISILVLAKFDSAQPPQDHTGYLQLTTPLRQSFRVLNEMSFLASKAKAPARPGAPYGYTVNADLHMDIGLAGVYWLDLFIDGVRVASQVFVVATDSPQQGA